MTPRNLLMIAVLAATGVLLAGQVRQLLADPTVWPPDDFVEYWAAAKLTLNGQNPFDEALQRLRAGIKAYNAAHNVPDTPTSGYNETTTHALLHLIAATITHYSAPLPTADAEAFCDAHPQLMNKHVLRLFYTPARRMNPWAKVEFVPPDLTPLPPY